jgi:hypothetical protein
LMRGKERKHDFLSITRFPTFAKSLPALEHSQRL